MKGWVSWREQRLDLSPGLLATHLRNYYRELRRVAPGASEPAGLAPATGAQPQFSTTGRRCLFLMSIAVDRLSPTPADLLELGHGVTLFAAAHDRDERPSIDPRVRVLATPDDLRAHLAAEGSSYDWSVIFDAGVGARYLMIVRAFAPRARVIYRHQPTTRPSGASQSVADPREAYCLSGADLVFGEREDVDELRALAPSAPISIVGTPVSPEQLHATFPGGAPGVSAGIRDA